MTRGNDALISHHEMDAQNYCFESFGSAALADSVSPLLRFGLSFDSVVALGLLGASSGAGTTSTSGM